MASYYVSRPHSEQEVLERVERVRFDGNSRVLLLYGAGGVGKTHMVRALAEQHREFDGATRWLTPIDVDDSEYWIVANLEEFIVSQLDPEGAAFTGYREAATSVQMYGGPYVGTETVLDHLSRLRREFISDYRSFVDSCDCVVVITLDTVETIRRMDLLLTVVQAMRVLPRTLLVLAGRPPRAPTNAISSCGRCASPQATRRWFPSLSAASPAPRPSPSSTADPPGTC